MARLALRRLALLVPTLLGVVTLVFAFLHLLPGDPVEIMLGDSAAPADVTALRRDLGLDQPLGAQYVRFLARAAHADLGASIAYRAPVTRIIAHSYPATLELAVVALGLALAAAIPLGVAAAVRPGSALDRAVRLASLVGVCVPSFWLGPLLILVFSLQLGWLPVSGRGGPAHVVLPAVTLGFGMAGILVRLTRASTLAALREDYVRSARARGVPEWRVLAVHALRNALLPVTTVGAAGGRAPRRRHHHRDDLRLARPRPAHRPGDRRARLPARSGLRAGDRPRLRRREHADRPAPPRDRPAAA